MPPWILKRNFFRLRNRQQSVSGQRTEDRYQKSEKREPQNTEQAIMNFEGKKTSSFEIPCSIFDIQNKSDIEMESVDRLMNKAIAEKIFPGGVLLVSKKGKTVFFSAYGVTHLMSRAPVTSETIFDLASLTKPLATTLAVMRLVQNKQINLEQHLGQLLPEFEHTDKARVKLEHLLYHNSGLPDYRPYYKALNGVAEDSRRKALRKLLVQEPCVNPIGETALYSDLGFMILAWVVEQVAQQRLDHFVVDEIYQPLGLNHLFFIQGHAGLFGSAYDINRLLIELLFTYHGLTSTGLFQQDLLHQFFKRLPGTDKALGFDTPSRTGSSCGQGFSQDSVGHLGFTGTSFWMDLERSVVVILLTNRVHPSRDNERIKKFRPELHDAVMNAIARRIF
jgi:CubicO group peptidase (beta-lactamase class C family)